MLQGILAETITEDDVLWLIKQIISSGEGVLVDEYEMVYFPGDDLFAVNRPRGLPIGNLTSQFWSNVYLTPLDRFVTDRLRCPAYLTSLKRPSSLVSSPGFNSTRLLLTATPLSSS